MFPFSVMDVPLALSEDGIHDVVWTDAMLAEWEVIVRGHKRTPETAASVTVAIRDFFADSKIEWVEYEHLNLLTFVWVPLPAAGVGFASDSLLPCVRCRASRTSIDRLTLRSVRSA